MIVIVHGYDGSGAGHWQRWLADELRTRGVGVAFPELPAPDAPERDAWLDALARAVAAADGAGVYLVAHSLGCWAVDHLVARDGAARLRGALLVAPPSPFSLFEPIQSFLPPPRDRAAWAPIAARTRVLGSDDDDYASAGEFAQVAAAIGASLEIIPGGGHLNAAAGYGPFPRVLDWLREVGAV